MRTSPPNRQFPFDGRRLTTVVLLVLLVALAGCGALSGPDGSPTATATATSSSTAAETTAATSTSNSTTTATPTTATPATDGSATAQESPSSLAEKGIDPVATWNRTLRIAEVNATRPPVRVETAEVNVTPQPFFTALTGADRGTSDGAEAQYLSQHGVVVIYEQAIRSHTRAELETILAHEYAHAIQYQHGWSSRDVRGTATAERMAIAAYSEGFATYVDRRYAARYPGAASPRNATAAYEQGSTYDRYVIARYRFGGRYFERRVNETGSLAAAAAEPPPTTEQVLHGTAEEPRPLDVRTVEGDDWAMMRAPARGELLTRIAFRDELPKERAVRAATGWGADRFYRVGSTPLGGRLESGFVWIQRWDTAADAAEFASAAEAFVENRSAETEEYAFETKRVAPETTALVYGKPGVPANTTVTAESNTSVTVRLGD